jgi:phosphate starvation-inducible PhoH-like protein
LNNTVKIQLSPQSNQRLASLCGFCDEHLRIIEKHLRVSIINRGHDFQIKGNNAQLAANTVKQLYIDTETDSELTRDYINLIIRMQETNMSNDKSYTINTKFGKVKARSPNQQHYLERIFTHDINFGIGPAGSGKSYLAVACAVDALEKNKVKRIILVRPAVEAGERLGFLPGDLAQKVDPYLRPLYDALYDMLGVEKVEQFIEKGIIEIAPLAYMRGRTLNDAFIILDESQNTTIEQMKMFLTRIGFSSTAVINGDLSQIDLPKHVKSGLQDALDILSNVDGISITHFESSDIVRHPLVQKIVDAYARKPS